MCFQYQEPGHYANQCPYRGRQHYSDRPSTSSDSRRTRSPRRYASRRRDDSSGRDEDVRSAVSTLSKSVAAMKEFYEEKTRRKLETKEAEEKEKTERENEDERKARKEAKAKKKVELAKCAADLEKEERAKMKKDLHIHVAARMNESEKNVLGKGKQKVTNVSDEDSAYDGIEEGSDTSVTQELNTQAQRLCISDKRKKGPEPVFEESSPMDNPPKRTPKRGILKPGKLSTRLI
ncbi:hypothetical protein CBR_g17662 [Chara braunii]|uniref:CCHC-type domain-containing protein n=1 Tax=Chara braunii TaxID=69332 RepID=A0A388KV76_CHABU|nr:hypothetical protein CBR_g17662 [Chara braunii]|eukprot:GBG73947.1 hypothetical protein CBR_g17662 [Chara braunii]